MRTAQAAARPSSFAGSSFPGYCQRANGLSLWRCSLEDSMRDIIVLISIYTTASRIMILGPLTMQGQNQDRDGPRHAPLAGSSLFLSSTERLEAASHLQDLEHGIVDGHKGVDTLLGDHQGQPPCTTCRRVRLRHNILRVSLLSSVPFYTRDGGLMYGASWNASASWSSRAGTVCGYVSLSHAYQGRSRARQRPWPWQ